MQYFETKEDFWAAFKSFDALYGHFGWQSTTARKNHEDLFGIPIESGEVYFRKDLGGAWGSTEKLSNSSMEKILYVAIVLNPGLRKLGDDMAESAMQRLHAAANSLSPPR